MRRNASPGSSRGILDWPVQFSRQKLRVTCWILWPVFASGTQVWTTSTALATVLGPSSMSTRDPWASPSESSPTTLGSSLA